MEEKELTEQIIGAAIEVHRTLGPGYLESTYEEALCIELQHRNIAFERQRQIQVDYRGKTVANHRLDLVINNLIVVELKAISAFENIHFATVRSYLKATGLNHGLLLNFASLTLSIKRVHREWPAQFLPDLHA